MTRDLHKSTQDLIGQIERKDRRFRTAQAIFMLATLIALVIVISAQQRTLDSVKQQLVEAKAAGAAADKRADESDNKIIRRLDCIVVFFTNPNRQDLTIEDIDKCSLNRDATVEQFFRVPESTPSETPPDLTGSSGSAEPGAPSPTTPQPIDPESPGLVPNVPEPPTDRPPVEVFGIPLCIPLTNVCIRQ